MKNVYKFKIDILGLVLSYVHQVHFIGIGGSGMSGIAKILVLAGYKVSGSDIVSNTMIMELISLGVKIFFNHDAKNIYGASIVVVSSAIQLNNPEILAAKQENILIVHRSVILSALMRAMCCGIAVAGTHGKSTTTGMIIDIYLESGCNPTFINGGIIKSLGTSAHLGDTYYLITEADESDASFLNLYPTIEVITNIQSDHMDTYQGDFKKLKKTFLTFLNNLPFYGVAIVCLDDPVIRTLLPYINRKVITYGFNTNADLRIVDYCQNMHQNTFVLYRKNMSNLYITANIPGRHNALNIAAAIAAAVECGIDDESILQAMSKFCGVDRRFDILGVHNLKYFNKKKSGKIMLISDYGHHPVELDVTIETIRVGWPGKRLVMVFQPHRFTRTRDLYNDFVKVLSKVDILLMFEVYAAGEIFLPGFDSATLCETIRKYGKINPILVSERILFYVLLSILEDNDCLLIQGAGTIGDIAYRLFNND